MHRAGRPNTLTGPASTKLWLSNFGQMRRNTDPNLAAGGAREVLTLAKAIGRSKRTPRTALAGERQDRAPQALPMLI